ncbi:MAG: bacillithiol biosynthesis BshC, partial [Acidobacteriota bacterium]
MRFRELQGFPELFADFAEGIPAARELFRCVPNAENLRSQALSAQEKNVSRSHLCELLEIQALEFGCPAPVLANIDKLGSDGTVVVVATLHAELLGGSLASWLSIVTAARLAAWLNEQKIPAVPLCWLDSTTLPFNVRTVLLS